MEKVITPDEAKNLYEKRRVDAINQAINRFNKNIPFYDHFNIGAYDAKNTSFYEWAIKEDFRNEVVSILSEFWDIESKFDRGEWYIKAKAKKETILKEGPFR